MNRPRLATVQIEQVIDLMRHPHGRMDRYTAMLALRQAQHMLCDWVRTRRGAVIPREWLGCTAGVMVLGRCDEQETT